MAIVNQEEIVQVLGLYTSQLYSNWYAAQVVVKRDGVFYRIRLPYNTVKQANEAQQFLNGKIPTMPETTYNPVIHKCDRDGNVR